MVAKHLRQCIAMLNGFKNSETQAFERDKDSLWTKKVVTIPKAWLCHHAHCSHWFDCVLFDQHWCRGVQCFCITLYYWDLCYCVTFVTFETLPLCYFVLLRHHHSSIVPFHHSEFGDSIGVHCRRQTNPSLLARLSNFGKEASIKTFVSSFSESHLFPDLVEHFYEMQQTDRVKYCGSRELFWLWTNGVSENPVK